MAVDERDLDQIKERYLARNLALAAPVDLFWGFALALIAVGPIIAVFLQQLGASNLIIGLAPVASTVGQTLLQLPGAHFTRNLHRKQIVFTLLHMLPCGAWIVAGLLAPSLAIAHPRAMIWVLLAAQAFFSLGMGFVLPIWSQLIGRLFPDRRRGLFAALIMIAGGLGGIAGGYYVTRVLAERPFPGNYAHLFVLAGVLCFGSVVAYAFCHEVIPPHLEEEEAPGMLAAVRRLWRADRRLRRYLKVRGLYEFGFAVSTFLAVYALKRFALADSATGGFVMASSLGGGAMGLLVGRLGDGRGYRRVLAVSMVFVVASTGLALLGGPRLFYLVFALYGAGAASDWIANMNFLVEMSEERTRGYYYALYGTLLVPVRLVAPLFWGWLGDAAGLRWAFACGLGLQVLGFLALLALVDDPRRPGERLLRWRAGNWHPRLY